MVRINCDYIPAFPIVYYKTKEDYKRETSTLFFLLWPLIVWKEKHGQKLFALLYILFRLTYKELTDTQFIDILWPIIHIEYSPKEFRFGIRPIMWVISGDGKFKFSLCGIVNIFSSKDGESVWFSIAPFIWYRYDYGRVFFTIFPIFWVTKKVSPSGDKWMYLLLPVGLLKKQDDGFLLNIAFIIQFMVYDSFFSFFILPFFIYHHVYNEKLRVSVAILFYYSNIMKNQFKRFVIFPILWSSWSSNSVTFNFYPAIIYMRRGENKFISIAMLYYYRAISNSYRFHFIPLILLYQNFVGTKKFLNVCLLFNHIKYSCINWVIVFPIFWFRKKTGSSYWWHLWPIFGYRKSHYDHGYSVYFIYPFIQFNNYQHGSVKYYHFFYRFIHYYKNTEKNRLRHGFLPLYAYSTCKEYVKGHVLLYVWYNHKSYKKEVKMNEINNKRVEVEESIDQIQASDNETPGNEEIEPNSVNLEKISDKIQKPIPPPPPPVPEKPEYETIMEFDYVFKSFLPITFYWRKGNNSHFLLLPLILLFKWSLVETDSYIFAPLFYQRRYQNYLKRFIIPIFYQKHTEDKDIVISPIYYYWRRLGNSFRLIAPIFVDVYKGETHLVILLLPTFIYYRKSIFKFTTLFPFFFRTQDASKNEIFTYWFPFYGKSYKGSSVNRYFLFPLFRIKIGRETRSFCLDVLFPLFHYETCGEDNSYSIRILPILWMSKNNFNEMLLIMPLFWRFITDKDSRPQRNTLFLPFYFYRDSAEYEFKLVTPCFLPPYYIHYHREASNVENTYLLPFYSHQIKGLDHLKWVCWFLYRHTYRDYSEYFTMNVFLFFKHNSEKYSITGFAPLWVYWKNKAENSKHIRVLLLVAYDKAKSKLREFSRLSIFWFVTTHLTLFCRQTLVKKTITKQESIADSINQMVQDEITPGASNINGNGEDIDRYSKLETITDSYKIYFFLLFHLKTDKAKAYSHLALFWFIKPYIALFYNSKKAADRICFFLFLFCYKYDISNVTFALFWLFHPLVSLFLYENTPFATITRFIPFFWVRSVPDASKPRENDESIDGRKRSSTRVTVRSIAVSILYFVPNYGLINYQKSSYLFSLYFLPIWYYKNSTEHNMLQFSFLWFVFPFTSLFNYTKVDHEITHRLFPLYYRITTDDIEKKAGYRSLFALVWLAHPYISFIRYDNDCNSNVFCIFPLFWRKYGHLKDDYHLSIIYIVRKFGFIDYWKSESLTRFYILCLFFFNKENEKKRISIVYLIHPRASFISAKFAPDYNKIFVFLAVYLKSSDTRGFICSIIWIAHPKVSFISYWSKNQYSHFHIFLLFWFSKIEEYCQVGIVWIGAYKKSLYGNPYVNQSVQESKKTHQIYCPISLFLSYNDGAYKNVYFMPFFRYWSHVQAETEKLWALLGLIYFSSKQRTSEFRWFYRWIRIKSGYQTFIVEVNPFISYKRKNENTKVLILGGMCGCYTSMCRVCCIEC
ncbi:hypothetical protein DICPUDRAFT_48847 [Dictyostelium purpureum]|uniref:Uncharacterized protein n=1 Tax=Dictyostelium purpureum TaxID=5786 RepID=F0ZR09_DICPU|nr:uncharacterized protein DICPUDRAFT_48847 [Dictyostelium purpureum]EGC33636.1 hypothetical protein DICPUDRAFT_48847 [Dictyostelium purpureum]|eukprot:XP_003289856.1 hypothetical protein DICPUDRAFT_48847 [Dictyostelium purpureum]